MIIAPSPYLVAALLIAVSAADVYSTVKAIRHGGSEIIPFGHAFIAAFGTASGAMLVKAIGVPFIIFLAFHWPVPVVLWAIFGVTFALAAVVLNNLFSSAN